MAYKKITQKKLTSLPAIRKRTAITQVAKPITVKKTSVSTAPVGRTNVGMNKTVAPRVSTATGVQYVKTTPSTARSSLKAALLKNKKK